MADMSPVRTPTNLPSLVKAAFANAKASGDLTYYPTQVAVLTLNSIHFQLRFSPALAAKPKGPPKSSSSEPGANKKPFNPFENPLPSMTVAQQLLPPSHALVLNKFAVVPEHFILITKTAKPQTHVLEADDVAAAHACVRAYRDQGQELFVFFNSGPHSGASQPHRHLQLLPVEQMRQGLDRQDEVGKEGSSLWSVLADSVHDRRKDLPFTVLSEAISADTSAEDLHVKYVSLYERAAKLVLPNENVAGHGEARFSYNMAMTSNSLVLCPRIAEGTTIRNGNGEDIGEIALNGTLLAGTALVKTQELYDQVRQNPEVLFDVLRQIGVPPSKDVGFSSL